MNDSKMITTANLRKEFYLSSIQEYNPFDMIEEHKEIIEQYRSPSERYLAVKDWNKSASEIDWEQLHYLCKDCYSCPLKERYKATIVLIHQTYCEISNIEFLQRIKEEYLSYL